MWVGANVAYNRGYSTPYTGQRARTDDFQFVVVYVECCVPN